MPVPTFARRTLALAALLATPIAPQLVYADSTAAAVPVSGSTAPVVCLDSLFAPSSPSPATAAQDPGCVTTAQLEQFLNVALGVVPGVQTASPSPVAAPAPAGAGPASAAPSPPMAPLSLAMPAKKQIAMELVSSNENSTLNWQAQYAYIQNINDGRGETGGIIGFTSGTGDMLSVVQAYTQAEPNNALAKYLPALQADNGSGSTAGLGAAYEADWGKAASDAAFQAAQNSERDQMYFNPAVAQAQQDGLGPLGQQAYYDCTVIQGPGEDPSSFGGIRAAALKAAKPPAQGGDEATYISAFLDAYKAAMKAEPDHSDTSRIDTELRVFLQEGNLTLTPPLNWMVYQDSYSIAG